MLSSFCGNAMAATFIRSGHFETENSRLDAVDFAWNSLRETKSLLQRIENKYGLEDQWAPLARSCPRHLPSQANAGGSAKNTSRISKPGFRSLPDAAWSRDRAGSEDGDGRSNQTPPSSRTDAGGERKSVSENLRLGEREAWGGRASPARHGIAGREFSPSAADARWLRTMVENVDSVESEWDMALEADVCSDLSQSGHRCKATDLGIHLTLDDLHATNKRPISHDRKPSPGPPSTALSRSPPGSPFAQRPELSRVKSPANKLEKLRQLIGRQRRRQRERGGSVLQPTPARSQTDQRTAGVYTNAPPKKLFRKVTVGPPAPTYRGFNVMETKPGERGALGLEEMVEETVGAFTDGIQTSRRELIRRGNPAIRTTEQRAASPPKNAERNRNSTTPKGPKRTALEGPGPQPFGVSAWREGQRLVRKLLGPPPKLPMARSEAESQDVYSREAPTVPGSTWVERKRPVTFEKGPRNSAEGPRNPGRSSDGVEGDLTERADGEVGGLPWAGGTGKEPGRLGSQREGRGTQEGTGVRRPRCYDAESVREYMSRRQAERKKKETEERRSVRRSADTKRRRLQEVYQKQREAFSKMKMKKKKEEEEKEEEEEREKTPQASPSTRGEPHTAREEEAARTGLEWQPLSPAATFGRGSVPALVSPARPLSGCAVGLRIAPGPGRRHGSRRQRVEALRGMAAALSGRVESEAGRLGVEARVSPGRRGWGERRPPASVAPTADDRSKRRHPSDAQPAAAAGVDSPGHGHPPRPSREGRDSQRDVVPEAEVCERTHELLRSSTSCSQDVLRGDLEPPLGHEPRRDLRETETETGRKKQEFPDEPADGERSFDTGEDGGRRRGHARNERGMSSGQDVNRSPMAPNTKRLRSPKSPSQTGPRSPSSQHLPAKQTSKGKRSDVVDTRHWPVRESHGQSLTHSALNAKTLDSSDLQLCTTDPMATDGVNRKWDPLTRRLSELMEQLTEETEQLSERYSSLTDDYSKDLLRSPTMSPLGGGTRDLKRNVQSPGSEESSVDGKGRISATGTPRSLRDELMHNDRRSEEQSLWALLPSESHRGRTPGSGASVQFGDNSRWNTESLQKPLAFGSQDAFGCFTLEMAQRYVKEEDLLARHQTALFRLREKALREKTAAELAWLELQKTHLRSKGDGDKIPTVINKQREILIRLQQEKTEIRNLRDMSRAAHRERALLLKQQEEIFRIRQSTAQLQSELDMSVTFNRVSQAPKGSRDSAGPETSPQLPDAEDWRVRQALVTSETGPTAVDQLRKTYSHLDRKLLARKEKDLSRRRQLTEELLEWKQKLDVEERAVHRIEAEAVAAWRAKGQGRELKTEGTSTEEKHHQNDEEHSLSGSKEPLGTEEELEPAANVPAAEWNPESWNAVSKACAAGSTDPISSTALEPYKTSGLRTGAEKMDSNKYLPITDRSGNSRGAHALSLKEELANRKAMMGKMRREQRRREREKLKVEEAKLCKELKTYDAFILEARGELISDTYKFPVEVKPEDKPTIRFASSERSNALDRAAIKEVLKSSTDGIQTQELPLKQGDQNNGFGEIFKTRDRVVSIDNLSPGTCRMDEKLASQPLSEAPSPSESVCGIHRAESQLETLTFSESRESALCSDADIEASDPADTHEEISQDANANKSEESRNNEQKPNGSSSYGAMSEKASTQLEGENSGIISPTKEMGLLLGSRQILHPNIDSFFVTSTASNHDSKTCKAPVDFVTNDPIGLLEDKVPQGPAEDLAQTTIVNTVQIDGDSVGLCDCSENSSDIRSSSGHLAPLQVRWDRMTAIRKDLGSQEVTAPDSSCSSDQAVSFLKSSLFLDSNVSLLHGEMASTDSFRTSDIFSPSVSYIDDFLSAEESSGGIDSDPPSNRGSFCSAEDIFNTSTERQLSAEQTVALRNQKMSSPIEAMALHGMDLSSSAQDPSSKGDGLRPVNEKEKPWRAVTVPPVVEGFSFKKENSLAVSKGMIFLTDEVLTPTAEDISSISEEPLSPLEEDSMFNMKELTSPVDDLVFYGSETFPMTAENTPFSLENLPPPPATPEEILSSRNDELPSPFEGNSSLRIEHLWRPSLEEPLLSEELPLPSDELYLYDTDDFPSPPPPLTEEIDEKSEDRSVDEEGRSRLETPEMEKESRDPLRSFHIAERVLVHHSKAGTLRFKGHTSFGHGYWAGVELDKAEGDHDGTFCGIKYFECTNKCGIFVPPDQITHLWGDYEVDFDLTDSEDSTDGSSARNYKSLGDEFKERSLLQEEPELTGNRKGNMGLGTKESSRPLDEEESCLSEDRDVELEYIIMECARAVESFGDSLGLSESEADGKFDRETNVSFGPKALPVSQGKDHGQLVTEIADHLTKHLVRETFAELTKLSIKKAKGWLPDECEDEVEGTTLTLKNGCQLQGQGDCTKSSTDLISVRGRDSSELADQIETTKRNWNIKAVENVTESMAATFTDGEAAGSTKIKRKHLKGTTSLSPQISVECLAGVLDAGILGDSSEEFKGLQPIPGSKSQKWVHALDRWCSGPCRQVKETVFIVPHEFSHVRKLVEDAVHVLWRQRDQLQAGDTFDVCDALTFTEIDEMDGDAESKRVYEQAVLDLTCDIFRSIFVKDSESTHCPCVKQKPSDSLCSTVNREDVNEVKLLIQGKVLKLLNLDRDDLEMKWKLQKLTKYGKSKRDQVDVILIQELQEESNQWVEYETDEFTVKMKLTEDIFNLLIHDTIDTLNGISQKRSQDQASLSSRS